MFELKVGDVEFLRTPKGRQLMAIPLPSAPGVDATVAYVAARSPISDTVARDFATLVPMLIMQGTLDDEWVAKPGPQTTRAHEMVTAFIARQLKA